MKEPRLNGINIGPANFSKHSENAVRSYRSLSVHLPLIEQLSSGQLFMFDSQGLMIIKVALLLFLKHAWEYCESNEYDEHYEKVSGKKLQYVRKLRHSSNDVRTSGILLLTIPEVVIVWCRRAFWNH